MRLMKKAGLAGLGSVVFLIGSVSPVLADSGGTAQVYQGTEISLAASADLAKPIAVSKEVLRAAAGDTSIQTPAEAKITKDEAVALARKALEIPDEYTVSGVNFFDNKQGPGLRNEPSWNINFSKTIQDRYNGNINVIIGADTGRVTNWNKYDNDPEKRAVFPPKADIQKAKEIALQYLQSVNPEEVKQTRYNDSFERSFQTPLNGDIQYFIRYDRTVNGIPFPANGLSVQINGNGEVVGYQYQWDDSIKFEEASGTISHEQAVEIVSKQSEPTLTYIIPYQPNKEKKPIPAYRADIKPIDGKTGKTWSWNGLVEEKTDRTPLSESPLADKPNPEQQLTQDQAIEAITSILHLPEGAQLENVSYNEYQNPYQASPSGNWNINWRIGDRENPRGNTWIFAGVDAYTGQVRNFNKTGEPIYNAGNSEEAPKVSFDDAKSKAIDIVKKAAPYYANQIYLQNTIKPVNGKGYPPSYNFQFKRAVDGVDTEEWIGVTVDSNTGDVIQFNSGISNLAYPEHKPEVIDPAKARELLLAQYDVELQYVVQPKNQDWFVYPYNIPYEKYSAIAAAGRIPPGIKAGETEGKLVYLPVFKYAGYDYDVFLDAATGQWRQRSTGEEAQLGKPQATDISGNPAEQALRLLVEYRALDLKDGKVNPDQVITRGEFIKILIVAVNGWRYPFHFDSARPATFNDVAKGSAYFAYVETALDQNLIDRNQKTFRPEDPLTREDLAELFVRALGYNQLAGQTELFRLDVSDADQISRKGQAALVTGLGILPALDGKFAPKEKVTRADAAAAFYRYLEKRAGLQERPGYFGYFR